MAPAQEWDLLKGLYDLIKEDLLAQIAELDPEVAAAARAAGSRAASSLDGTALGVETAATSSAPAAALAELSAAPSKLNEGMLKELERLTAANEAMKAALATGTGLAELDSRRRPVRLTLDTARALEASAERAKALASKAAGASELERLVADKKAALEFKQRGVDICILMDCTSSMMHCIEQVKSKAQEIFNLAPTVHPDCHTRLAFVGYRDYCDGIRFVVQDFVGSAELHELQAVVNGVEARGGGDPPEDVAGGLQNVLGLAWSSSTRLLIHFADAPCHGKRYHSLHEDKYPAGDPSGLVPEELLKQLVANRVDYYFARITHHTDMMTGIFKKVFDDSPGTAVFQIHEYTNKAERFMPLIVKSLTSSMRRTFCSGSGPSSASSGKSSMLAPGVALPAAYAPLI